MILSILGFIGTTMIIISTLFVVMGVASIVSQMLIGKRLLYIAPSTGRSMEPSIPRGFTFTINVYPFNLSEGDTVVIDMEGLGQRDIYHRIIDVDEEYHGTKGMGTYYKTKGDGNDFADGWFHESRILAKGVQINGRPIFFPVSSTAIRKTYEGWRSN